MSSTTLADGNLRIAEYNTHPAKAVKVCTTGFFSHTRQPTKNQSYTHIHTKFINPPSVTLASISGDILFCMMVQKTVPSCFFYFVATKALVNFVQPQKKWDKFFDRLHSELLACTIVGGICVRLLWGGKWSFFYTRTWDFYKV